MTLRKALLQSGWSAFEDGGKRFEIAALLRTVPRGDSVEWLDAECDVQPGVIIDSTGAELRNADKEVTP